MMIQIIIIIPKIYEPISVLCVQKKTKSSTKLFIDVFRSYKNRNKLGRYFYCCRYEYLYARISTSKV